MKLIWRIGGWAHHLRDELKDEVKDEVDLAISVTTGDDEIQNFSTFGIKILYGEVYEMVVTSRHTWRRLAPVRHDC